jgi:3-keto-disaccharide hydrolase
MHTPRHSRPSIIWWSLAALLAPGTAIPAEEGSPDALVKEGWIYLFDSRIPQEGAKWSPLSQWRVRNPGEPQRNLWSVVIEENQWVLRNTITGSHGTDLISLQDFWDFDLHVELRVPENSNSGVYLRGRYEIQVLSTPAAKPKEQLSPGDLGGIYSVKAPAVNASKGPGQWQTLDIGIRGFAVTVRLNGQLVQDHVEIPEARRRGTGSELGSGDGIHSSDPSAPGPVFLQGDHGSVDFRNIRIRPVGPVLERK